MIFVFLSTQPEIEDEIKPFAAISMDLEIVTLTEVSQTNVIQKTDFTALYIDFGTTVKIKD